MGNMVSVAMCYRLNKEHNKQIRAKKERKNKLRETDPELYK